MSKPNKDAGEFDHESLQDAESIVAYLEALSAGFRSGRVLFCWGKQEMVLHPSGLLQLEVKARRKDRRVRVSVAISWKERSSGGHAVEPLVIKTDAEDT